MTQLEKARAGEVTPEMAAVARAEQLDAELVRLEVAEGRMVIPANTVHLAQGLAPIGIGIAARTKVNANIGKSALSSDLECEAGQAAAGGALRGRHRNGPLDRRRYRRRAAADHRGRLRAGGHGAHLPGGRAAGGHRPTCGPGISWTWSSSRPAQGVDYMTIHCAVLRRARAAGRAASDGHCQPRRLAAGQVDGPARAKRTRCLRTSTSCARSCGSTT